MPQPVILSAVRTPIGRIGGVHRDTRPEQLLAHVLRGLADRAKCDPAKIEDVVCGCVTQTGEQGGNVARLGVLLSGFPVHVPATTVNRWCGSSQQALHFAAQSVAAGDANYVIAAGVESMTRAPIFSDIGTFEQLSPPTRAVHELVHQGESGERIAEKFGITREACDRLGLESHRRASLAARQGLHRELIPTAGLDSAGQRIPLVRDEGIRDTSDPAKVAALQPVYRPVGNGVLTAANSSQFGDGAAAILLADREVARSDGFTPRARFLARVVVADDPTLALMGVVPATQKALARAGLTIDDLDWIEFNEAFSTIVLAWASQVGANLDKVNPWGGAIAHGHAVGATGCVLMSKLLNGLETTGGRLGMEVMCIGFGQATATIIERLS